MRKIPLGHVVVDFEYPRIYICCMYMVYTSNDVVLRFFGCVFPKNVRVAVEKGASLTITTRELKVSGRDQVTPVALHSLRIEHFRRINQAPSATAHSCDILNSAPAPTQQKMYRFSRDST